MAENENEIGRLLSRNVEEAIEKDHLHTVLSSGKKLRVKLGIDPTSPDLHLGHAVLLRKLREFQELGHQVVLIVGDFTGRIGDPSGRAEARQPLTADEIKKNMKSYLAQAGKILNIRKTEVVHNSDWFDKEGINEFVRLASAGTFEQVLRRADFQKRIEAGQGITFLELLYPLFQGYDSVKVKADVELGGTDQKFNLLTGRHVQRHFDMPEQDVMTVPLLEGLDGVKKMSKSLGNYIGLTDAPNDMFGKTMSVPDTLVKKYFMLCTDISEDDVNKLTKELGPKELKERLGYEIVMLYHGEKEAKGAQQNFNKLFSEKEITNDITELTIKGTMSALDIVIASGTATSKSEARRLIEQGGLDVDQKVQKDPKAEIVLRGGEIIKIGKRRFFKVKKG